MFGGDRDLLTICAVSTPPGVGGISVIRVSGADSLRITRRLCSFLPIGISSHKAYFGILKSASDGRSIDEVLVTYFADGRSFTGEEVIEISCHGNPLICSEILSELVILGAKIALPGEFTYRAFLSGRIDLVQAESILSLIEGKSKAATKLALRQLEGGLSKDLNQIEDGLTWLLANFEASIDFSHEDIDVLDYEDIESRIREVADKLFPIVDSYKVGRLIREGIRIALVGRPNVGKSSLLNLFLDEDRAIVTDIAGTTRDVISGETSFNSLRIVFLDTAGIREDATDLVEKIGIQRSIHASQEADRIFLVFDFQSGFLDEDLELIKKLELSKLTILVNKYDNSDVGADPCQYFGQSTYEFLQKHKTQIFFVSAFDKTTRGIVFSGLSDILQNFSSGEQAFVSTARQYEDLSSALECIERTRSALSMRVGAEFLSLELKEALIRVQRTLGKSFDDQIMDRVFKEFCIGK